jgi:Nucleotide modification associated domain 3
MRIIFSRKGFASGSGGGPSPIINCVPISLPIPTKTRSKTSYGAIGLGDLVKTATKGRLGPDSLCHEDPMFHENRCAFGQTASSQSHLARQGVGVGNTFLFFGLFAEVDGQDRHHRIFGYLKVEKLLLLGRHPIQPIELASFPRLHPHTIGEWNDNNTVYLGRGNTAKVANAELRLSKAGGLASQWHVPNWLKEVRLSYHGKEDRWIGTDGLRVVGRGQEFVANVGDREEPRKWLNEVIAMIEGRA